MEKETMKLAQAALKVGFGLFVVAAFGAAIYTGWNWAERRAIKKGIAA